MKKLLILVLTTAFLASNTPSYAKTEECLRIPASSVGNYYRLNTALSSSSSNIDRDDIAAEGRFKEVMGHGFENIANFYIDPLTGRYVFQKELKSKSGTFITYYYENSTPVDIDGKMDDLMTFYDETLKEDEKDIETRYLIFKALAKYRESASHLKGRLAELLVLEKSMRVREEIQVALNLISGKNLDGGKRLNVVFAGYELGPFVGRGGIKDVLKELPRTFKNKRGHTAAVFIPYWRGIIIKSVRDYNRKPEVRKSKQYVRIKKYGSSFFVEGRQVSRYVIQMFNPITGKFEAIDGVPINLLKCDEFFSDIENGDIYRQKKDIDVPGDLHLIDHENARTAIFFSKAFLEALKQENVAPDLINTADWQTALTVSLLRKSRNKNDYAFFNNTKIVHTIHNIGPKGIIMAPFAQEGTKSKEMWDLLRSRVGQEHAQKTWEESEKLWEFMGLGNDAYYSPSHNDLEFWGRIAFQKSMVYADQVVTVGKSYADELKTEQFGSGFEGISRVTGVLGSPNGVSLRNLYAAISPSIKQRFENSPAEKDRRLGVMDTKDGKLENKKALVESINKARKESSLPDFTADENTPVFCFLGRFDEQKGMHILLSVLENENKMSDLLNKGMKFIFAGTGALYEARVKKLVEKHPHSIAYMGWVNEPTMKQIFAGVDINVMPSIFEPKGIVQMQAARFGAINLVNKVGGLKDDIVDFSEGDHGNGYVIDFSNISINPNQDYLSKNRNAKISCRELLYKAFNRAMSDFSDKEKWGRQVRHVLSDSEKFGWDLTCMKYEVLFNVLTDNFDDLFINHKIDHAIEDSGALQETYDFALSAYIQSLIKFADVEQRTELQKKAQAIKKLYLYLMKRYEKDGLLAVNYHRFTHSMEVTKLAVESAAASGFGAQKDAIMELMAAGMLHDFEPGRPADEEPDVERTGRIIGENSAIKRILEQEIGIKLAHVKAIITKTSFPYDDAAELLHREALSGVEIQKTAEIEKLSAIMQDSGLLSTYIIPTPELAEIRVRGLARETNKNEEDVIVQTIDFLEQLSAPAFNRLPGALQDKYRKRFESTVDYFRKLKESLDKQLILPAINITSSVLRVPFQKLTYEEMLALGKEMLGLTGRASEFLDDPAAGAYIKTGTLLKESYDAFKIKNPGQPFIVLCAGHPVSGKTTLLEQIKVVLESSGKKVIIVPKNPPGAGFAIGWNSYGQMIEEYGNFDALLYETDTSAPDEFEKVGLFIYMEIDEYTAANRYSGGYYGYAASKGHDRLRTLSPYYYRAAPDISLNTTSSNLSNAGIRKLLDIGMQYAGQRDQKRERALQLMDQESIFTHREPITAYVRSVYQQLITYKDRYPVEGKRVLYIGNSFSPYPFIDAALGASEVIVTDNDPNLITIKGFMQHLETKKENSDISRRIKIIEIPIDARALDIYPDLGEKFYQVNMWNVLNDERFYIDPEKAIANCLKRIENGGGLWINNLARSSSGLRDIRDLVPKIAEKYGLTASLDIILDLPTEAYNLGLCYYYRITEKQASPGKVFRPALQSI